MSFPLFARVAAFLFVLAPLQATDGTDAPSVAVSEVDAELKAVIAKIQAKLQANKRTVKDLAEDIQGFDTILKEHRGEKTDDVANVLLLKAVLYIQVLDDAAKGNECLDELKRDFPGTNTVAKADGIIASLERQQAAKKTQTALAVGTSFPNFDGTDIDGKPISVSAMKGKVLLVEFWATWSPPSVDEMPNVVAAYLKYREKGFAIIGVSLDRNRLDLATFVEKHKMEWPQCFGGMGWQSDLALKYGVDSIPMAYLLDKDGNILAKGLRGEKLGEAIGKALGEK